MPYRSRREARRARVAQLREDLAALEAADAAVSRELDAVSRRMRHARRWPIVTAILVISALCSLALGAGRYSASRTGADAIHLDPNAVDGAYAMPD